MFKINNNNSKIKMDFDTVGQDNDVLNPFLKTKLGKLLFIICSIPMIASIFFINWKQIYYNNKELYILQLSLTLISIIYILINYIISKINIHKKETSFKEVDYKYYRDILNETSSGVLSFVYNKKINYKDIIISTLLKFDKEKLIKINYDNHNIEILSTESNILTEYEKYILFFLKTESTNKIIDFSTLKYILTNENFKVNVIGLIKKDSKNKGYYKTINYTSNVITYIVLISFCIMVIEFLKKGDFTEANIICLANTIILFLLAIISKEKIYLRTKQGKILSDKLNGLKNFLLDFSTIKERKIKEIALWDYYIIYAIIFNLKGNLDKDVNELYNCISK